MYTSRGIGRQAYSNDRRNNDKDRDRDRKPYQSSSDNNHWSDSRDYDRKPLERDRRDYNQSRQYRDSPDNDNSYGGYTPPGPPPTPSYAEPPPRANYGPPPTPSYDKPRHTSSYVGPPPIPSYGGSNREGSTPPGPPPTPSYEPPLKNEIPSTKPYVPMPSEGKPMQPNYSPNINQGYSPNPVTQTPVSNSNANPSAYRPNPNPNPHYARPTAAGPYGAAYGDDEDEPTPEEKEKMIWARKCALLFEGANSIDDLITLKEQYLQKSQNLDAILKKSNIREGEILRNKRRNRDDFKDPAMLELRKMQVDIKMKLEEVNKYRVEIDKRIRQYQKAMTESVEKVIETAKADDGVNFEKPSNYEALLIQNSMITTTAEDEEEEEYVDEYEYENLTKEYYDPGTHWCRDCDKMVSKITDFFEHLHTKEHWNVAISDVKPWRKPKKQYYADPAQARVTKTKTAIKGAQFLIPLKGYYCPLCKDYLADNTMAEEHMKGAKHNRVYNRFLCLNMDYEEKWNADKGKALSRHQQNERKRVKDEEQKELEKKRKTEEQKQKEEKEAKKRKKEEEIKRKLKEEKEREREREREAWKKNKSAHTSNSSERFRLKEVTMNLKDEKSSHKEKDRGRDRDKDKKRVRIYSSSSDSSSPPPKKKVRPYPFENPNDDPKIRGNKSFVRLTPMNRKTAKKYRCKELLELIESAKLNKQKTNLKIESKTVITIVSDSESLLPQPQNRLDPMVFEDEDDNKPLKENNVLTNVSNAVDNILEQLEIDENDPKLTESDQKDKNKDNKKDNSESVSKVSDIPVNDSNFDESGDKISVESSQQLEGVLDSSLESEPKLLIDTQSQ